MKRFIKCIQFISFLILMSLFNFKVSLSQCNEFITCESSVKYPYYVCYIYDLPYPTKADVMLYCTNDPLFINNPVFWDGHNGQACSRKAKLPICLNVSTETVPQLSIANYTSILSPNSCIGDASITSFNWNCLCGYQDLPCECSIRVFFSSNKNYFVDSKKPNDINPIINTAAGANANTNIMSCEVVCINSFIVFNNTAEFRDDYTGSPKRMFVNSSENSIGFNEFCNEKGLKAYSFKDILSHELGHILGLGHYDTNPNDNYINKSECSVGLTGIMYSKTYPNRPDKDLLPYDKCMFKKLYCPQTVGLLSDSIHTKILYPNPANKSITIEDENLVPDVPLYLIVYGVHGDIIQYNFSDFIKNNKLNIDISSYKPGVYYIKIEQKPFNSVFKFVVK